MGSLSLFGEEERGDEENQSQGTFDSSGDHMIVDMSTPWGNAIIDGRDPLSMIKFCLGQLKYMRRHDMSPNPEKLKKDIAGYEAVINSNCADNARAFMKLKQMYHGQTVRPDNMEIVEQLKTRGEWIGS